MIVIKIILIIYLVLVKQQVQTYSSHSIRNG